MLARKFTKKNFTLVEAMLTAAVVAIIAVLVIPFLSRANQKGRYTSWVNHRNSVLTDGDLMVYYDFTDAEGHVIRNTARGVHQQDYDSIDHDGRLINSTSWAQGRWGLKPAIEFDGSGGHLSANAEFSKQSQTFVIWFKSDMNDAGLFMTSKTRKLDSRAHLKLFLKKGNLVLMSSDKVVTSKKSCTSDKWHMAAVTLGVNLKKMRLYLDGELAGESAEFEMSGKDQRSFVLGFVSGSGFMKGRVGEFMAFSRELSEAEVQKIYASSQP